MHNSYFHRVTALTNTRFWINNPTREEAVAAIEAGAVGCTLNPSYTQKMLDHPQESGYAFALLDECLKEIADDNQAIAEFQRRIAAPITKLFEPIHERSEGQQGWVSIQADPIREIDAQLIIDEGRLNRAVAPNVCCKIPLTEAGLEAIEVLLSENTAINATEIFSVDQGLALGELVQRTVSSAKIFYSHIAGIYDDYLYAYAKQHAIEIPGDYIAQAGLAVSKRLYALVEENAWPISFVGGGARGPHHFFELVGGDLNVTINWKGTADLLLDMDLPVIERISHEPPTHVIAALLEDFPDFRRGWEQGSLQIHEFEEFGPVGLFNSSFAKSWTRVLAVIAERRATLKS